MGEPRVFEAISTVLFGAHLPMGPVFADDVGVGLEMGFVVKLCSSVDHGM